MTRIKIPHRRSHGLRSVEKEPLHEEGASLVVCLIMLVAIMMMGISGVNLAINAEKGARSDRDHQIAFQSAEAALVDAELDITGSPDKARSRSSLFSNTQATGFPTDSSPPCHNRDSAYFGLCRKAPEGLTPTWLAVDFLNAMADAESVPYGTFTGKSFETGHGSLPSKVPRYIIELIPFKEAKPDKETTSYLYRITAIGFGLRPATQVVLQTFFRKEV